MSTANWIKQAVSGTPGTGTITLGAAEDGFVGIGDWFADGDNVHYFAEDGDNREEGRGVFASGAGTLTRGEIVAKLDTGTLTEYPGTGLTLGTGTIITINPSASLSLGNGTPFLPTANDWDIPDNFANYAITTAATTADRLYLYPAVILFRRRINNMHLNVTTGAGVAADATIGIWDQQVDGNPGNLLLDSGIIDVQASGFKDVTVSPELVLNPGVYWFGFVADNALVKCKGFDSGSFRMSGGFGGAQKFSQLRRGISFIDSPTIPLVSNLTVTSVTDVDDSAGVAFT